MEKLLSPDIGLTFWTLVNFTILLIVLVKVAWKPLLKATENYEAQLKKDKADAEEARNKAQAIKKELEDSLANLEKTAAQKISEAVKLAGDQKDKIIKEANDAAQKIADKNKQDLLQEKQKVVAELRKEVSDITISLTEKLLGREVDEKANSEIVSSFLKDLGNDKK